MSERPSSKARFWETLQDDVRQRGALPGDPSTPPPTTELSPLAERILEILLSVKAATVFELQTRLGIESESEIQSAAGELKERGRVDLSTRETDIVVTLSG